MLSLLKSLFRNVGGAHEPPSVGPAQGRAFVAFITTVAEPHFLQHGEVLDSDLASTRLRAGIPGEVLAQRIPVCFIPIDYVQRDPALAALGTPRAVVVGKLSMSFLTEEGARANALLRWIEASAPRLRVIVDFADDIAAAAAIAGQPGLIEFQTRVLRAAAVTVPSLALKERLSPLARHGVTVIEDPYESVRACEPAFAPGPVLRLAWFGVFGEHLRPFVEAELAKIAQRLARPVELAFVTDDAQKNRVGAMASRLRAVNPQFELCHVTWSVAATADALARADIVVLPQDAGSDWGRVKSHNRLVEALRAGRFTVASPIPSYMELAPYAWVADDLAAGIEWALAHPHDALGRVCAGQAHVAERFAPARIGALWAQALGI